MISIYMTIGIIIEYMDRGSLEFMLDDNLEVSEPVMAAIVYQILWGLGYLHYDNRLVSHSLFCIDCIDFDFLVLIIYTNNFHLMSFMLIISVSHYYELPSSYLVNVV